MRSSAWDALESTWSKTAPAPDEAKQLLRIPQELVQLKPNNWALVGQCLLGRLTPGWWIYARAKQLLCGVQTFEGRAFIYEHLLRRTVSGERFYSEKLDIILRKFEVSSKADIAWLDRLHYDALRAFAKLKLLTPADIRKVWTSKVGARSSTLLWLLVSEGLVRTGADIGWMRLIEYNSTANTALDHEARQAAFAVIEHLTEAGVPGRSIARALSAPGIQFRDTDRLPAAISELRSLSLDVEDMLLAVGDRLWRTRPSRWQFMVSTMGLTSPTEIAQFGEILDHHVEPAPSFVSALKNAGATCDDLLACEGLLRANADPAKASHCATAVQLLTNAPFNVAVGELADFDRYFSTDRDLIKFFQALTAAGYHTKEAALAFQPCYTSPANHNLAPLLSLASSCSNGATLEAVADWVNVSGSGGYIHEMQQLTALVKVASIPDLHLVAKLAPLGAPFVSWLVRSKKLGSIKALKDWHRNAVGIVQLRLWSAKLKTLDILLLEDAWNRNSYSLYLPNRKMITEVAGTVARHRAGKFPFDGNEVAQQAYHDLEATEESAVIAALEPAMPSVLRRTGGVLVASVVEAVLAGPEKVDAVLAAFQPLLLDVAAGRGPITTTLTPAELEAIALVYRTDVSAVQRHWPHALGYETACPIAHTGPFHMRWKASRQEATAAFDRAGFDSVLAARAFADKFNAERATDMQTACTYLRARSLTRAAQLKDVANHLGSLFVLAGASATLSEWTMSELRGVEQLKDGDPGLYTVILKLERLFGEDLEEALSAHVDGYVAQLSDEDSDTWATRLGLNGADIGGLTGKELLKVAIKETRALVVPMFAHWAATERKKFKATGEDSATLKLNAVVTKYPAAFLARTGASLCTSANYDMWVEDRHAHLVAYDPVLLRMAGMAYVYVENVPTVNPTGPVLVIRAVNTPEDVLSEYSPDSIVSEFFRVATVIAQQNGLSHVCFCDPMGIHLMSNRDRIEDGVIKPKYVKTARPGLLCEGVLTPTPTEGRPTKVDAVFSAYELGHEKVGTLYVIWDRAAEAARAAVADAVRRVPDLDESP